LSRVSGGRSCPARLACDIFISVEISWLGHSCFRIKGSHATIVTDPYSPGTGYTLGQPTASIVTVSHDHPGHNYIAGIGGQPRIISRPGEYEISDVLIISIATFHDAEGGKSRGRNTIALMEIDGLSVCHLGDLGHALTSAQVEEIGSVDVLLLPVGGVSTINAAAAAAAVRQLDPKIVIPMHYQTPALCRELEPVEKFLKEIGAKPVSSQPKLSLTRLNIPAAMQVSLLDYPR
jgi:L-ascorbate metabolism protein UlaG (beta-lactamase superfamily)